MSANWIRKAKLQIGAQSGQGLDLSQMHFRFSIKRNDVDTPNSADITVYNLSDKTVKAITTPNAEFTRVVLQAGYEGNFGIIFDGQIAQLRVGRDNPTDTYLNILAQDMDMFYNFATVNVTLAAGITAAADQLATLAKAMGVPLGSVSPLPAAKLPRGKVFWGMARDHLRTLSQSCDASWGMNDGSLDLTTLDAYQPGEIPVLTAKTGLVGMPEQTTNGITARCLLNPFIKVNRLVKLDNASIQGFKASLGYNDLYSAKYYKAMVPSIDADGLYRALVADHTGDTRGDAWWTDMILLATDPSSMSPFIVKRYP